jgi:quinoprotein relay system zinc metallohydrolase 2
MTTALRRQLQRLPCALGLMAMWLVAFAADGAGDLQQIAEGVYVRPGNTGILFEAEDVANLGVVIGARCVAVIDTGGSAAEGRALGDAIRQLTEVPVCFVINTHVHPDHVFGNEAFEHDDVEFIGHEKLPRAMAVRGDTYLRRASESSQGSVDAPRVLLPGRTVSDRVQIDLGGRTLILTAHPAAHSDNDLSVLDEETGTLFAGDLVFLEHLPVLDGSINGWIDELGRLTSEAFQHVVPGHGPVRVDWPAGAAATMEYLHDLRESTRQWIARGGELGKAQQAIEASRPERWQLIEEFHKRNVAAAFAELEWED